MRLLSGVMLLLMLVPLTIIYRGTFMLLAPHCDTRRVLVGMTREEVLEACPGPDDEYDFSPSGGEASTFKFDNARPVVTPAPSITTTHWMIWHSWSHKDVVTLIDGRVDYTMSDRDLSRETSDGH